MVFSIKRHVKCLLVNRFSVSIGLIPSLSLNLSYLVSFQNGLLSSLKSFFIYERLYICLIPDREWLLIDSKIQIDMTLFKINPPKGMDTQFDYIVAHIRHMHREKKQFIYKPNKQGIRYWPRKKDMCVLVIISYIGDIPIHGVVLRIKGIAVIKGRNINHVGFSLCAWETAIHLLTHSDKNIEIHAI